MNVLEVPLQLSLGGLSVTLGSIDMQHSHSNNENTLWLVDALSLSVSFALESMVPVLIEMCRYWTMSGILPRNICNPKGKYAKKPI